MVVPHLRTVLAFGGPVFRGCALRFASCTRHSSRFAASDVSGPPLLIGLTTACFRHRRRPSCAPLQFPLKSYGFPGAETVRKRFLLWKMGFSAAAYCDLLHPSIQHGRSTPSHRPALTLARCSAPADFASLRVLGAPAASRPPTLASSLAELPASLGLLRPVSRTARGLRAPPPYTPPGTIVPQKGFRPLTWVLTVSRTHMGAALLPLRTGYCTIRALFCANEGGCFRLREFPLPRELSACFPQMLDKF